MKICFISHYPELFGANLSLLDILDLLIEQNSVGHEGLFVIIPSEGRFSVELQKRKIFYSTIPFEADWFDPSNLKATLATKKRIRKRQKDKEEILKLIRKINPDVIHTNSSVTLAGAYAARALNIPHVWHIREDIKNHYQRRFDSPKTASEYMRKAFRIIATSKYIKKEVLNQNLKNVDVIYNFISNIDLSERHTNKSTTIFGVVGLIHKKKNQEFIAKAMIPFLLNFPHSKLIFYGNGSEKIINDILIRVNANPKITDQVEFKGYVNKTEEIYGEMDVLINLSEFEAFGRVNLEANANGIPIIGLKSGATIELIENGKTGFLIDKSDSQLRIASEKLLDLEIRNTMSQNARRSFLKFNNPESFAENLLKIYKEAVSEYN